MERAECAPLRVHFPEAGRCDPVNLDAFCDRIARTSRGNQHLITQVRCTKWVMEVRDHGFCIELMALFQSLSLALRDGILFLSCLYRLNRSSESMGRWADTYARA